MKKILIVDDDQFILKVYQKKFETEGILAEVAGDGPSALASLRAGLPELVLLDLMLPGMSGVEILGHIRAMPGCADLPVIVFSHSYDEQLVGAAKTAGATQCLNKNSVSPNRLLEIVRAALAAPRQQSAVAPDVPFARSSLAAAASPLGHEPVYSRDELRTRLAQEAAAIETRLQELLQSLSSADPGAPRLAALVLLRGHFDRLALDAGEASLRRLAFLCRAVTLMLDDLRDHPEEISVGTFRTLVRAIETVPALFGTKPGANHDVEFPSLVLVVHPQRGIAPLLAETMRGSGQPAVALRDPATALAFIEDNVVDIIVTALELALPNGTDLIRRARALPGRGQLSAILLSNQPAGAPVPEALVAHQILAFPYTAEEVAVSTIIKLVKRP